MKKEKNYTPDWENSYKWKEFEWEKALKFSDHIASRYFRMLDRFCDLPGVDELIAKKLGGDYNFFYFDETDDSDNWYDDLESLVDPEKDDDFIKNENLEPGDALYFESCPAYQKARQMAIFWCNIVASILDPDDRFWGVRILFLLGRMLSYISLGIDDGTFEHINGNIIFVKRALQQINVVLMEIEAKNKDSEHYNQVFMTLNKHLLENRDLLVSYLLDCRKRQKGLGNT